MKEEVFDNQYSIISNIINNGKISHALLFEVDDCDSSMSFVKNVAKLILCKDKEKNISNLNCGNCNICNLMDMDNYPDFVVISTDSNWIKKQQLIDLQNEFNNKSLLNNKRIYVIKEAEKLNVSSSNSLLKFLEEPEDDIIAILLTKNRYLLLDTILSRCQIYSLRNSDYILNEIYLEKVEVFIDCLIRQKNLFVSYKYLLDEIFIDKQNTKQLLNEIEKYFLTFLVNDVSSNIKDGNIYKNLNKISVNNLISYVKIIESEKQKLEFNVNYKIWLDSFFARIIGEVYD